MDILEVSTGSSIEPFIKASKRVETVFLFCLQIVKPEASLRKFDSLENRWKSFYWSCSLDMLHCTFFKQSLIGVHRFKSFKFPITRRESPEVRHVTKNVYKQTHTLVTHSSEQALERLTRRLKTRVDAWRSIRVRRFGGSPRMPERNSWKEENVEKLTRAKKMQKGDPFRRHKLFGNIKTTLSSDMFRLVLWSSELEVQSLKFRHYEP